MGAFYLAPHVCSLHSGVRLMAPVLCQSFRSWLLGPICVHCAMLFPLVYCCSWDASWSLCGMCFSGPILHCVLGGPSWSIVSSWFLCPVCAIGPFVSRCASCVCVMLHGSFVSVHWLLLMAFADWRMSSGMFNACVYLLLQ